MPATAIHAKNTKVYYDCYRVSPWASSTGLTFAADAVEYTPLEDGFKLFTQGKASANGSTINGFMDVGPVIDSGFDAIEFADLNDGKHYILRAPQGTGIGGVAYETVEASTGTSRAMDIANVAMLNWSGQPTEEFWRGMVITAGEQAFTATGEGTGVEVGATTATLPAQRMEVVIRVVSVTGAGSIGFQIQESSDDGVGDAYADITLSAETPTQGLVTYAANTATFTGVGTIKLYTTAATEAWKRLQVSAFATFTSVSVIVTCGIADVR
jgi:hypothetical protein